MFDANEPVFKFPACRGIQGSRVFYAAVMPLSAVSRLIQMDDGDVLDRSQRDIDAQRVKSVKKMRPFFHSKALLKHLERI